VGEVCFSAEGQSTVLINNLQLATVSKSDHELILILRIRLEAKIPASLAGHKAIRDHGETVKLNRLTVLLADERFVVRFDQSHELQAATPDPAYSFESPAASKTRNILLV
jgi:hypothetical protein